MRCRASHFFRRAQRDETVFRWFMQFILIFEL